MFTQLTTILVMVSLLFGGAGATVYAAQDSMPDDVLYPVKTVSEDVGLGLAASPQAKLNQLLRLQTRRMEEVTNLSGKGELIQQRVWSRLEKHLDDANELAASMEGEQMRQALQQIQAHNQEMLKKMAQEQVSNPDKGIMNQLRQMIETQNQKAEQMLRIQTQLKTQEKANWQLNKPADEVEQVDETTILSDEPASDTQKVGPCETCEPALDGTGPSWGPGPMNMGEETHPDEGYGPATPCETCEPALDGTGPGPGPANQGDTSKQQKGSPEPVYNGNGPGPGPGPSNQGEITQPEDGYGPQGGVEPPAGPQGEVEPPAGSQGEVEPPAGSQGQVESPGGPATGQGGGGK